MGGGDSRFAACLHIIERRTACWRSSTLWVKRGEFKDSGLGHFTGSVTRSLAPRICHFHSLQVETDRFNGTHQKNVAFEAQTSAGLLPKRQGRTDLPVPSVYMKSGQLEFGQRQTRKRGHSSRIWRLLCGIGTSILLGKQDDVPQQTDVLVASPFSSPVLLFRKGPSLVSPYVQPVL